MIKGFILDIDGTLVDSNDAHAHAWVDALSEFGYSITYDEVRVLIGMGGDRLLPAIVPELSTAEGKGKEITELRRDIFLKKYVPTLKPAKGSRNLIETIKKLSIKLVVATSSTDKEVKTLLEKALVHDLIHEYTSASDVENSKPAGDIVASALQKLQLSADSVYMLGDTPYDIASAAKNGVKTIALRSGGFSDEQLTGAAYIYDNPLLLKQNLEEILK